MSLYDRFGPSIEDMKKRVVKMKSEQNADECLQEDVRGNDNAKVIPISAGREKGN